jgi:hypothetical protein
MFEEKRGDPSPKNFGTTDFEVTSTRFGVFRSAAIFR